MLRIKDNMHPDYTKFNPRTIIIVAAVAFYFMPISLYFKTPLLLLLLAFGLFLFYKNKKEIEKSKQSKAVFTIIFYLGILFLGLSLAYYVYTLI